MSRRTQPEKPSIPSWLRITGFIIIALFAAVSAWQNLSPDTSTAIPPIRTSAPIATEDASAAETPQTADDADALIIHDVSIYDVDGDLAYAGDVDLAPTLDRIERGESDPHDNDGAVFQNREGLLPAQDRGYYHEYVVRTPGLDAVGPQRLILGAEGEVYYTPDHYATFTRIR